ncbi:thioredoxin domain-containing protein [Streptomyces akebiae]|uniref:DsbA family protein n=1 Tax=Streptomyces akebiae TaxID=2865673 RepID=A0ABX8XPS2_9ACTN|nr:thioredoxin domain-containing protein [Streptomyces akebiae]QYX77905.1 DsbA family protein [Streptomyces akebiae]
MTAVVAVALGLLLGGCGERAARTERKPAYGDLRELPEELDADGTTIRVGDPHAPVTLRLYEDMRCPVCEEFERTGGPAAVERTLARTVVTEYTLASFLDDRLGGNGSKKAANALRAALEEGKFAEYHAVLYANQPEEIVDGFTDAYLLELAAEVKGLRGPAFDSAVRTMKYRDFVARSQKAFDRVASGTPTADINGNRVREAYSGVLYEEVAFGRLLDAVKKDPEGWEEYTPMSQDLD